MTALKLNIHDLRPSRWVRRLRFLLNIALFVAPVCSILAAESEPPVVSPGRYLLVVDTSSSMRRYAENMRGAIEKLFLSGMNGQLREGDTIGVWTYNENLYTGGFPLQLWKPESRQNIAANITSYLQRQPFEKECHLEKVMPTLVRLVRESGKITIVFVSNGDSKMVGSPFDRAINMIYDGSHDELQKLRDPFLTVLRAQRGRWIGYSVTWSPWPVEFPQFLPEPPKPVRAPTTEVKQTQTPKPAPKPLIVIGKKPEPPPATTTETTETTSENVATQPVQELDSSQQSVPTQTSVEQATSEPAKTEAVSVKPVVEGTVATPAEPVRPTQPQQTEVEQLSSQSSESAVAESQSPPAQTAVALAPEVKSNRRTYFVIGLGAMVAALGLAFLLMRHERKGPSASLITRSMDREK